MLLLHQSTESHDQITSHVLMDTVHRADKGHPVLTRGCLNCSA